MDETILALAGVRITLAGVGAYVLIGGDTTFLIAIFSLIVGTWVVGVTVRESIRTDWFLQSRPPSAASGTLL